MNISYVNLATFFLVLSFKNVISWSWTAPASYNPYCYVRECCNKGWITNDIAGLRKDILERVYGQHLVEVAIDAIAAHLSFKPQKALTLSFHGWSGSGKNYVANFIAENLYREGTKSSYVHHFISRIHFPTQDKVEQYKFELYTWLKGNISRCPHQLFVFDEVDKMSIGLMDAIKPMLDYRNDVDGQDYTSSIFIFLSNTGAGLINDHYEALYKNGRKRESLTLKDFDALISKGAFNEQGGFYHADPIRSSLVDHYIPFLPMHEHHVKMCIRDEFKKRGVFLPKDEHIQDVLDYVEWGPDSSKLYSKTGCKRMDTKVGVLVQRHYPYRRTEL